jgi:signal transduction histidine kinase
MKHNFEGGEIIITSDGKQIVFSNTGKPLTTSPGNLFQRFVKHNAGSESTGLGLSIASGICKNYKMGLEYTFQNGHHNISLNQFNP